MLENDTELVASEQRAERDGGEPGALTVSAVERRRGTGALFPERDDDGDEQVDGPVGGILEAERNRRLIARRE